MYYFFSKGLKKSVYHFHFTLSKTVNRLHLIELPPVMKNVNQTQSAAFSLHLCLCHSLIVQRLSYGQSSITHSTWTPLSISVVTLRNQLSLCMRHFCSYKAEMNHLVLEVRIVGRLLNDVFSLHCQLINKCCWMNSAPHKGFKFRVPRKSCSTL